MISQTLEAQHFVSHESHKIMVFNQGLSSLEKRLRMIERAQKSIEVEYYIFKSDDISSRLIIQALLKKAQEGVRVRLLLDGLIFVLDFNRFLAQELMSHGVEIKFYNTWKPPLPIANHRNHRKHLIIDSKEVIMGGRNVEDKYFDLSNEYNFLDRDVWISGPIAHAIHENFNSFWEHDLSHDPVSPISQEILSRTGINKNNRIRREQVSKQYASLRQKAQQVLKSGDEEIQARLFIRSLLEKNSEADRVFEGPVEFVADGTFDNNNVFQFSKDKKYVWEFIKNIAQKSQKNLLMESPYFVLSSDGLDFINDLKHRNITFEVLINGPLSSNRDLTANFYLTNAEKIAQTGVLVSCYQGIRPSGLKYLYPFANSDTMWGTHAKTIVFDLKDSLVGSFNMDPRSKNINLESILYFPNNPELSLYIKQDILNRKKHADIFFNKNKDTGHVVRLKEDCEGLSMFECISFRIQRPLSVLLEKLL